MYLADQQHGLPIGRMQSIVYGSYITRVLVVSLPLEQVEEYGLPTGRMQSTGIESTYTLRVLTPRRSTYRSHVEYSVWECS